jgi:hypothetical protein
MTSSTPTGTARCSSSTDCGSARRTSPSRNRAATIHRQHASRKPQAKVQQQR